MKYFQSNKLGDFNGNKKLALFYILIQIVVAMFGPKTLIGFLVLLVAIKNLPVVE